MDLIAKLEVLSARAKNPWFKEYWKHVANHLKNQ